MFCWWGGSLRRWVEQPVAVGVMVVGVGRWGLWCGRGAVLSSVGCSPTVACGGVCRVMVSIRCVGVW